MKVKLMNVKNNPKGEMISCDIVDATTGEIITPMFDKYTSTEDYKKANVKWVEPMTAKEYLNEEELEKMLTSHDYYAEQKLDGTRATLHIGSNCSRIFSRRISKKTEWFSENTDSVPHLREIAIPELEGTVIDGEMRIDGKEFKEVSSTLNCDWSKAIVRQTELGFITLHAFDIIYYKNIYIAKMPLWKRKQYLEKVIKAIQYKGCMHVVNERFTYNKITVEITDQMVRDYFNGKLSKEVYPNLHQTIRINCPLHNFEQFMEVENYAPLEFEVEIDKRTWYEFILYNGGEGLMLKHKDGKYFHERGREYTKWKKYITRDCIIIGFTEPTKEYNGDHLENWCYWEDAKGNIIKKFPESKADLKLTPISKFYAEKWIGNIRFGVVVNDLEIKKWEKANKTKPTVVILEDYGKEPIKVLEVGECAGFDEEMREEFTKHKTSYIGKTVEILANEIFKDTGKLRHPRFLRIREDKNTEQCTWNDHINA